MKSRSSKMLLCLAGLAQSLMSFSASAEDILLSRDHISLQSDRATLIRTAQSPKKIKVDLPVAIRNTVCAEYGTQMIVGPDLSCGQESYIERVLVNRCIELARCTFGPNHEKHCQCVRTGNVWEDQVRTRTRSCLHPVTVCVRHDVATQMESKRITIQFKNVARLAPGEQEIFDLHGEQQSVDGLDIDFRLDVIKSAVPYDTKSKERSLFNDKIIVNRAN